MQIGICTHQSSGGTTIADIEQQCSKANLLLACSAGIMPGFLDLAAMAPRADVLFDCGAQADCVHDANGVGWYYASNSGWGFAPAGDPVHHAGCDDVDVPDAEKRLCWSVGGGTLFGPGRCGNNVNGAFERRIYHSD